MANAYSKVLERTMQHAGTSNPKKIMAHFDVDEAEESKRPEKEKKKEEMINKLAPLESLSDTKSITKKIRDVKSMYGKAARNGDSSAVKSAREKRIKLEDILVKRGK
jgi:hypothetical protein